MENATPAPLPIEEYLDYRALLRDRYRARKQESASFSYRFIAGKVGLDAGTVARILNGDRNLDPEAVGRMARVFRFDARETQYFEALVLFNQARSQAERNQFLERLFRLRGTRAKTLEERQYDYYREWHHLALRELLNFYPCDADPKSHAALGRMLRPAISAAQARKSLELLLSIGLVEKGEGGRLRLAERVITSGEGIKSLHVKNMQVAMGELALRALADVEAGERDFSGVTFSLSPAGLQKAKERLRECRRDLLEIAERDQDVNCAYRLNLQLFPVSRPHGRDEAAP